MDVARLAQQLREFAAARDWDQFHNPKNLVMALSAEAGELTELFQWLTEEQSRAIASSPEQLAQVREEIADIQIYLLRLADVLDVDLERAVLEKIASNDRKYPIDIAKGNAVKYNRNKSQ